MRKALDQGSAREPGNGPMRHPASRFYIFRLAWIVSDHWHLRTAVMALRHATLSRDAEGAKEEEESFGEGRNEKADERFLTEFAILADRLGFKSDNISALKARFV